MAYLEIKTDEGVQKVPLGGERLSIGRLSFNDIALPSPQISRQHAELRRIDGAWWIADLNSTNGLHLHGRRIQDYCLTNGDEISLSPSISVRFVDENTSPEIRRDDSISATVHGDGGAPEGQSTTPASRQARLAGFTASNADEQRKTHPIAQRAMQIYPPVFPPEQLVPVKPRSIYADDEVPFVPDGMAAPTPPAPDPPSRNGGAPTIPYSSWHAGPLPGLSSVGENREGSGIAETANGSRTHSGGYPVQPGALESGSDTFDPYRRSGALQDHSGSGEGSVGNLLHVCQTCGQLTSPDSVYCQSCHHSIAHECVNCRLSLLPIQDRCPRCHTPNDFSVRRAHPGR
jgi:pSer/pThr/pTyr-binding forkhead associated (FHA) protein